MVVSLEAKCRRSFAYRAEPSFCKPPPKTRHDRQIGRNLGQAQLRRAYAIGQFAASDVDDMVDRQSAAHNQRALRRR
jgi:hypothetical protein